MVSLATLTCPRCGADVPVPPPGTLSVRCEYCGNDAQVIDAKKKEEPPPPVVPRPAPTRPANVEAAIAYRELVRASAAKPKASSAMPAVIAVMVLLLVGGGIAFAVVRSTTGSASFQWRSPVVLAQINGDGIDDFIGAYASRNEDDYPIYVAGFDGATNKELWRAGPYGKNASELKYVVIGKTLVITDADAKAHLVDIANGTESASVALTDKADEICEPKDAKGTAWIGTSDQKGTAIDLGTHVAHVAPRPAGCAEHEYDCDHVHSAHDGCTEDDSSPKFEGFNPEFVLHQGDDVIAVGSRSPGTATPMAIAFNPADAKIRWQKPLVPEPTTAWDPRLHAVDMLNGRLIVAYLAKDSKAGRLMALSTKTGAMIWDVPIPNTESVAEASDMTITQAKVYLPHWTYLEIFDVQTGAHVDTLGAW